MENSLRNLVREILLEDEMGKFLVKGLNRARALEKGEEFVDNSSKNKNTNIFSKKTISEIIKDDLIYKYIIKTVDELQVPKNFSSSLNKKPEIRNFFTNARKFLTNKSDYDFLKNKVSKDDLKKFKDSLSDKNSKAYFNTIMDSLSKITLQSVNLSDSDSEMKEMEYLYNLNLKSIVSENLQELDFSSLRNKISNFFSRKTGQQNNASTQKNSGSLKKKISPIKFNDAKKIKSLPFGNKLIDSSKVSPFLIELFFVDENGVIKAKKNTALSWMMKNNVDFEIDGKISIKSDYDKNNILPTDIIFRGNWNSGEFKGTFASGQFLGGIFNGGIYNAPSLNFMPNKTISEKLKTFKNGVWQSMDGLFGLKFIEFPTKSKNIFSLELPINSYAIFQTDIDYIKGDSFSHKKYGKGTIKSVNKYTNGFSKINVYFPAHGIKILKVTNNSLYKVTIIKQPRMNNMKFIYNVAKRNEVNKKYQAGKNVEGQYDDIRTNPKEFVFSKKSNSILFWKNSSYPELSNPVNIKNVIFGKNA